MHEELLIEEATVLSCSNGSAEVEINRNEACEHCTAKFICRSERGDRRIISVENNIGAGPGDKVRISVRGRTVAGYSCMIYGMPLIILIASIYAGIEIFKNTSLPELYSFMLGAGAVAAYFFIFLKIYRAIKPSPEAGLAVIESKILNSPR